MTPLPSQATKSYDQEAGKREVVEISSPLLHLSKADRGPGLHGQWLVEGFSDPIRTEQMSGLPAAATSRGCRLRRPEHLPHF